MNLSSLSDLEQNLLMQLSYSNVDPNVVGSAMSMEGLIASLGDSGGISLGLSAQITASPGLMGLSLTGYRNFDPWSAGNTAQGGSSVSGFVGFAFSNASGETALVFRGTQDGMDWADNAAASTIGESLQVADARRFFQDYGNPDGGNVVFGHSKGGNLASEVFIANPALVAAAHVFNAQPLNWLLLSPDQQELLKSSRYDFVAVNYDVVSKIGITPYDTRHVRLNPDYADGLFAPHDLRAALYDDSGNGYAVERQPYVDKLLEGAIANLFQVLAAQPLFVVTARAFLAVQWAIDGISQLGEFADAQFERAAAALRSVMGFPAGVMVAVGGFFGELGRAFKRRLNAILERLGRVRGGSLGPVRVNTGQLRMAASTLGRVQNRIVSIDRRLDRLRSVIEPEKKLLIAAIDWQVGYDYKLAKCISYLNSTAQRFESGESVIMARSRQFRA